MAVPLSYTPTSIVKLIVEILELYHGRILESRTLASLHKTLVSISIEIPASTTHRLCHEL